MEKTLENYQEHLSLQTEVKIAKNLLSLPQFCEQFFVGIENKNRPQTRLKYSYDLKTFFQYVHDFDVRFQHLQIIDYPIEILDKISSLEIEQYLKYIKDYTSCGKSHKNGASGVKSKLFALRALYSYFFNRGLIAKNVAQIVDSPQIKTKNIIRLNDNQIKDVIYNIETSKYLSREEALWNERYRYRDLAVVMLLLGTGIRVSECSSINLSDINYTDYSIRILRKGGNEDRIYFSDELADVLRSYHNIRLSAITKYSSEPAFFLSKNGTRLSVRSIQNLVHKYTRQINEVSPHKLRTTFGTKLYIATKDIYLVSEALGHSTVETTRKHYTEIPDLEKQKVRNVIKLR